MATPERFAQLVRRPDPPLAEGCVAIAEYLGHPEAPPGAVEVLDRLAESTAAAAGPEPDLDAIARHLFVELGFRGDRTNYYDERNSLLAEVLERRIGIPITLAVVAIEVADRLDVAASPVGMPGHFLLGDGTEPRRWLDGFEGAVWLDEAGARSRFAAIHGPSATFDPAYLRPTPPAQVLARVVANLAGVHRARGDRRSLLRALELRSVVPASGSTPRALVELAEAQAAVGHIADAIDVIEALAERVDPRRRQVLEARVATLRATLN